MTKIKKIYVCVQTVDRENASSNDKLYASIGPNSPFELSGSIPARGKAGLLTADVDLDYLPYHMTPVSLSVSDKDAWSPHVALMWGEVDDMNPNIIPLARNFIGVPNRPWVSQEEENLPFRTNWPLYQILLTPSSSPAYTMGYNEIIIYLKTSAKDNAGSSGPLEFSIYSRITIEGRLRDFLFYHTTLPKIFQQTPSEKGGHYLFSIPTYILGEAMFQENDIVYWRIENKSKDMWVPEKLLMFFISDTSFGKFVSMGGERGISLDIHDQFENDPSWQAYIGEIIHSAF